MEAPIKIRVYKGLPGKITVFPDKNCRICQKHGLFGYFLHYKDKKGSKNLKKKLKTRKNGYF